MRKGSARAVQPTLSKSSTVAAGMIVSHVGSAVGAVDPVGEGSGEGEVATG